jgi:O-antigen ligase
LRAFFGFRVEDWRLNRTMVVLLLLIFPYLLLATQNTRRHQGIALAAGGIALPAIAILHSQSGAAEFGLIMGVITFILALCFWQLAWWGSAVAAVGTIMSAPWLGSLLFGLIPDHMHEKLRSMSTAIRIDIWRAFGSAVSESPILGAGFNVAASFDREPAFRAIPDQLKGLVEFGHAHSAALQIWVEFGLVGALIAAILALLTLRQIDRAPERLRPVMLAAFNACFVIAVVSHGAWQAWWAGAIGGLILLFFLIAERERRLLIT